MDGGTIFAKASIDFLCLGDELMMQARRAWRDERCRNLRRKTSFETEGSCNDGWMLVMDELPRRPF